MPDKSIVTRLRAVTAVTDLVSTRIRCGKIAQSDSMPAIAVELDMMQPVNTAGGTSGTKTANVSVRCRGTSYSSASAVADAAETALNGWTNNDGTPPISMVHVLEKMYAPGPDVSGQDEVREQFTLDCFVSYGTTL